MKMTDSDNSQLSILSSPLIPPGYKQTEVGVIPEDWDSCVLGQSTQVTKLAGFEYTIHFDYSKSGSVIAVRALNIKNGRLDLTDIHTIPKATSQKLPRSQLYKGDLVMSYVGSLGRVTVIPVDDRFHLAPNVAKISVDKSHFCPYFLAHYLNSFKGQKSIFEAAASTTQAALSMRNLRLLLVAKPPLPEQRSIATVLSDVDALIESLDKLISKKRNIKQAAMQELLTGKTRLPGFYGDWDVLNMGKQSTLKARIGWQGLTTAEYLENGQYALVTGTDFIDGKIDWNNCHFVKKDRYDQDKNIQLQSNDILLTKDGTIGKVAYVESLAFPATLNSGVFVIRPKDNKYNSQYFFYVLMSQIFSDFLNKLQAGSTISHLYQKDFINFEFFAPATAEEQLAIAAILSDIDTEIEALETRRSKTLDLKQGMMQELLTGKTRLVKPEVSHVNHPPL